MSENVNNRSNREHSGSNAESTKMKNKSRGLVLTSLAVAFAILPAAAAGDGTVVLKVGKIITNAGATIENGTIVIENGRITDVGPEAAGRWDAPVREFPDLVAFPGFVEAITNRGMDRPNENVDVAPFLDVRDSIDPVNFFFEDCLRWGVTTVNVQHGASCVIGAQGHVVKPFGMTVEQMSVRPRSGIVLSASPKSGKSRATQAQALRRTFTGLRTYLEGVVQEKRDGVDYATREARYQGREPSEETARGRSMGGEGWKVDGLELVPRCDGSLRGGREARVVARDDLLVPGKGPLAFGDCDFYRLHALDEQVPRARQIAIDQRVERLRDRPQLPDVAQAHPGTSARGSW